MKQKKRNNKADAIASQPVESATAVITVDLKKQKNKEQPKEYGGRKDGLDPTRYGDWEKNGRCIDF